MLFDIWFASFLFSLLLNFNINVIRELNRLYFYSSVLMPQIQQTQMIWLYGSYISTDHRNRVSSVWCWPGGSHGPCPTCFCCHIWLLQPRSSNAINRIFTDNTFEWWTLTNAIQYVTQKRDVVYSIQPLWKAQWSPNCAMGMCVNVQKVRKTVVYCDYILTHGLQMHKWKQDVHFTLFQVVVQSWKSPSARI